jgi:hypothetical protein
MTWDMVRDGSFAFRDRAAIYAASHIVAIDPCGAVMKVWVRYSGLRGGDEEKR